MVPSSSFQGSIRRTDLDSSVAHSFGMTSPISGKGGEGRKGAAKPPLFSPSSTISVCHSDEERGGICYTYDRLFILAK